jgi:hypothetical protein
MGWFEEGESLETSPEQAPYEPFQALSPRVKLATMASALAALLAVAWLLSSPAVFGPRRRAQPGRS